MAIPSGSGSETLHRQYEHGITGATNSLVPGTNCIYSILNVIFCDQSNAATNIGMYVHYAGSTNIQILETVALPAYGTFVFSDRFILRPSDQIKLSSNAGGGGTDVIINYIYQDWT